MTWRCANRRRRLRRLHPDAAVQPHLGDVIGAPLAPMRPVVLRKHPGWIESTIPVLTASLGVAVYAVLVIAAVAMLFVGFPRVTPWWVE